MSICLSLSKKINKRRKEKQSPASGWVEEMLQAEQKLASLLPLRTPLYGGLFEDRDLFQKGAVKGRHLLSTCEVPRAGRQYSREARSHP